MNVKQIARWAGVGVSAASVLFAILTYNGVWNEWRGDNLLAEVATRFDSSYSQDAGLPVRPGDRAWPSLMRVIVRYSHAPLLAGREPRVFARFVAVASAQSGAGHGEWTAPTTPVALIYKEWPGPGVTKDDFVLVGTIGDLHSWIQRDEGDFDFFIRTILFGVLSSCIAIFLALPDKKTGSDNAPSPVAGSATTINSPANVAPEIVDRKGEPP